MVMDDSIVIVEEAAEGSYLAHTLRQFIFTMADKVEALHQKGREMGQFRFCSRALAAILADVFAPSPDRHADLGVVLLQYPKQGLIHASPTETHYDARARFADLHRIWPDRRCR
jgi:hypothetical protein